MADVRLTATNPEDSSVVPVACNSKGELLVDKPVIEEIDNDVVINGQLSVAAGEGEADGKPAWNFYSDGRFRYENQGESVGWHSFEATGFGQHRRDQSGCGKVLYCRESDAIAVQNQSLSTTFSLNYDGTGVFSSLRIALESNNPDHYVSLASKDEAGVTEKAYKGPEMDVAEELLFLRAQVRALMEKLKMSPEGGWPVWDGESAS